jgi:multiple sugar transport system substrate-binding protein
MRGEGDDRVGAWLCGGAVQSPAVLADGGAGLLAGAGLLGAAGCGGGSSGDVTLRYGIRDQTQMPAMEKIVKEFSKAHPDISVEIELTPYDEYLSKLQNAAQGGTLPDVFWMEPL